MSDLLTLAELDAIDSLHQPEYAGSTRCGYCDEGLPCIVKRLIAEIRELRQGEKVIG